MSIELSVRKMKSLLDSLSKKSNAERRIIMQLAHDVCTASRFIHLDTWRFCAKYKYVKDTILPTLERAKRELTALLDSESLEKVDKEIISSYIENDKDRIKNLRENYLQGKPSAFRPDHMLSEPESSVG